MFRKAKMKKTKNDPILSDEKNLELFFVTEVLKLKSLHYGLFEKDVARPISLKDIAEAQSGFTDRLLSHIPDGVRTVLDVGSGIGDNARAMAAKGIAVTAVSPDRNHAKYYEDTGSGNIEFHNLRFEDFEADRKFDMVLFSESLNYMNRGAALKKSRKLLKPGGHLLVANMFLNQVGDKSFHELKDDEIPFVAQAKARGFDLLKHENITEATAPTLEPVHLLLRDQVPALANLVGMFIDASSPWKARVLRFLFRRQERELREKLDFYLARTNPARFLRDRRYLILLFRAAS